MKRLLLTAIAAVSAIFSGPALADSPNSGRAPAAQADSGKPQAAAATSPKSDAELTLNRLQRTLERVLAKHDLKATFTLEDGVLTASYNTRAYLVHGSYLTGDFAEKAAEEVGPRANGFIIRAQIVADQVPVQTDTPQTVAEAYWTTRIIKAPLLTEEKSLLVRVSTGARVDEKLRDEIVRAVERSSMAVCQQDNASPPARQFSFALTGGRNLFVSP